MGRADKILSSKGRSFHWARHLLGKKHAERATRLYAFCRHLDDLADEAAFQSEALERITATREDILRGKSNDAAISDGIALARECRFGNAPILDLLDGAASDLEIVRIEDVDELIRYCYRVAGTVGLMMCRVLDVDSPAAYPHAIDLGIAMQLTNICRDVVEDASMGRRYFPASLVGDLSPEELMHPDPATRSKVCLGIADLLQLAEEYYKSGESGLSYLPLRVRASMLVAARVYHGIGIDLTSRGYDCWSERAMVSMAGKALISVNALVSQPLKRSFWCKPCGHRSELQSALAGFTGVVAP
jgi:phytoene synthase